MNCEPSQRKLQAQRLEQPECIFMMLQKNARILLTRSLQPLLRTALSNDHQRAALSGLHQGTEYMNHFTWTRGALSEKPERVFFKQSGPAQYRGAPMTLLPQMCKRLWTGPGLLDM